MPIAAKLPSRIKNAGSEIFVQQAIKPITKVTKNPKNPQIPR
jgi:hypothetical protein